MPCYRTMIPSEPNLHIIDTKCLLTLLVNTIGTLKCHKTMTKMLNLTACMHESLTVDPSTFFLYFIKAFLLSSLRVSIIVIPFSSLQNSFLTLGRLKLSQNDKVYFKTKFSFHLPCWLEVTKEVERH